MKSFFIFLSLAMASLVFACSSPTNESTSSDTATISGDWILGKWEDSDGNLQYTFTEDEVSNSSGSLNEKTDYLRKVLSDGRVQISYQDNYTSKVIGDYLYIFTQDSTNQDRMSYTENVDYTDTNTGGDASTTVPDYETDPIPLNRVLDSNTLEKPFNILSSF